MALTQVSTGGIKDGQVHTADLADAQITAGKLHADALDHTYTLGASGSNHYTFTGEGLTGTVNDPTLYLTRGKTYRFVNGNSAGAHPFRIQSVAGAGGTEYNTGVTNNAGGGGSTIIFEVPHDAPDVLYYICTSHPAMNGIFYVTGALADGTVTTAKLADDAVTTDKLANSINTEIAANTAKVTNATHTGEVTGDTALTIADNVVDEANLKVSNSPTNGYFLSAQSGNTGGLTWAQVAQPDLTNLSATNLTSGTVPDARFPATLPAASGANLTNLVAANLTGALPAIDGSNLTGLGGGGKITRVFQTTASTDRRNYTANGYQYMAVTVDNVPSTARYLIFINFGHRIYNNSQGTATAYATNSGGNTRGYNFYSQTNSTSTTNLHGWLFDYASNTTNRTYEVRHYSNSYASDRKSECSSGAIIVLELDFS
jgi:hypothetical protein